MKRDSGCPRCARAERAEERMRDALDGADGGFRFELYIDPTGSTHVVVTGNERQRERIAAFLLGAMQLVGWGKAEGASLGDRLDAYFKEQGVENPIGKIKEESDEK